MVGLVAKCGHQRRDNGAAIAHQLDIGREGYADVFSADDTQVLWLFSGHDAYGWHSVNDGRPERLAPLRTDTASCSSTASTGG